MSSGDSFLEMFQAVDGQAALDREYPFYPLTSAGMPIPGPDFIAHACQLGDDPPVIEGKGSTKYLDTHGKQLEYLYRRALYDANFSLPVMTKGITKNVKVVPGHMLGDVTGGMGGGPRPAKVLLLVKQPTKEEMQQSRYLCGAGTDAFQEVMAEMGLSQDEIDGMYVTSVVKWGDQADGGGSIPASHKVDCAVLLEQELRLVRPDFILCLGAEPGKALLGVNGSVSAMIGRCEDLSIETSSPGEPPSQHIAKVMVSASPGAVARSPELYPEFKSQVQQFISLVGGTPVGQAEIGVRHYTVYKLKHLRQIIDGLLADPNPLTRIIAVDGEWDGEHETEPGAYLRTIQFSARHKESFCVVLRHQGGRDAFKPNPQAAIQELKRLLKTDESRGYFPRIGGFWLRADLPWLIREGLDLRDEYAPSENLEDIRDKGGIEASLMIHAHNETASYRLTDVMARLTTCPVYDIKLKEYVAKYCSKHKLKKEDLAGYGMIPAWILHPEPWDPEKPNMYSGLDADVTRRIIMRCIEPGGLLDRDSYGNSSWEPYWIAHRASLGVLEMEMEGIALDRDRVDELTTKYMVIYESLIQNFRAKIGWVDFNPNSAQQCVALLFGQTYVRSSGNNTIKQVLPDSVRSLGLTPVKTTGKRAKLWDDVVTRRQQHLVSVSTDKEVLGVLGAKHPLAMMLRDIKFVSQILKGPLRAPIFADDGSGFELDGENLVYEKGLAGSMTPDGKVHTHISQHKETGRYASARPALQNISSKREADYERICGIWQENADGTRVPKGAYLDVFPEPQYTRQIRSIFKADPDTLFVEADVTGAELAAIAWAAQDPTMTEHVRRNLLPEKHPDHYDVHSHMAVKAFKLSCAPTKSGLKSVNALHLRVGAKSCVFGIPYGRGPEAISRQLKEEGVHLSVAEAEDIMRTYFELYPRVGDFLQDCRQRSQTERWLAGSFGRYRRFIRSTDKQVIGEQERQACNFSIQNCVADAVSVAISNFYNYKKANPNCGFSLLLQIHDALLFKVRIDAMVPFCKDTYSPDGTILHRSILRRCMIDQVPIFPRYLDNTPIPVAQPYFFGTDMDICENWGETIADDRLAALGLSELISE